MSIFVECVELAVEDVDGGAEADGGRGAGAAEGVFEGVESLEVEFANTGGGGFGEEGALPVELGGEGGALPEPEVDGGSVNLGLAGGGGDGGTGEQMREDLSLHECECGHGDLIFAGARDEGGRVGSGKWLRGNGMIYFWRA